MLTDAGRRRAAVMHLSQYECVSLTRARLSVKFSQIYQKFRPAFPPSTRTIARLHSEIISNLNILRDAIHIISLNNSNVSSTASGDFPYADITNNLISISNAAKKILLSDAKSRTSLSAKAGQNSADPFLSTHRDGRLTFGLNRDMSLIEMGPAHSPIIPKKGGWRTTVVDYTNREGLLEHFKTDYGYKDEAGLARVEDVDVIWNSGNLSDAFPEKNLGSYDACISSHNIEHLPDFISFFVSMSKLLSKDGVIHMAIPDKRYTFDWFRPVSTTGQVLQAYNEKRTKHQFSSLFDIHMYHTDTPDPGGFGQRPLENIRLSIRDPMATILSNVQNAASKDYYDTHGWVFTPASFALIIYELWVLEIIDFDVTRISPAAGIEFIVHLARKSRAGLSNEEVLQRKLSLMKQVVYELGEQAEHLRDGEILSN